MHFPHWSLQRIAQQQPELRGRAFALTRPIAGKGSKIIACSRLADQHGVRPGMMVAEALATLPTLTCVDEDPDADRAVLIQLAEWSQRFSPIVGLEDAVAPTCLLIDVTGGAACFGGEDALLRRAEAEYRASGWIAQIALADTIGAAWALAACGLALAERHASAKPQAALPVHALRLSAPTLALLAQLGIERIEQLTALPRAQIAERFGPEVGRRLDQMCGRVAEVITPIHGQPDAVASWLFDDPIERHEIMLKVLDRLLERLQTILEQRHCGTRLVECVLELDGAETQRFECSLSRPARLASYLIPLMRLKLEPIRVMAPVRAMCVRAVVLERLPEEQPSLFDQEANETELARLLDSLTSRLGKEAVTTVRFVADPQPELACRFEPAAHRSSLPFSRSPLASGDIHRPLQLFTRPTPLQVIATAPEGRPQRFHHAGTEQVVTRCQGPERIETGWWRAADIQRDYYLVETTDGTRWWIFQRLDDGRWFLHGCFD